MKHRRVVGLVVPPAVLAVRDSLRYGRAHGLSSRPRDWPYGYLRGMGFGLHLVPDDVTLDGLVIDVGANRGDFTAAVRRLEPRSRVLAIEPLPGERARLHERFAGDPNVTIDGRALSDEAGEATLEVADWSVFSSLRPAHPDVMAMYPPGTEVTDHVPVATARLDDLVDEPVRILKIDVQGHELPVLRAATNTLTRTDAVLLEVTFVSHYEGDASFFQLDRFMGDAGFELFALGPPDNHQGRSMWADACYVRPDRRTPCPRTGNGQRTSPATSRR